MYKKLSYFIKYCLVQLFRALVFLISYLPMSVIVSIAKRLESIFYYLSKLNQNTLFSKKYHVARVNLSLCFPDMSSVERERLLRENFCEAITSILHYGFVFDRNRDSIENKVSIIGQEYVEKYYGVRPVILFVPHFWGLDLGAIRMSCLFSAVSMMHDDSASPLRALLKKSRMRFIKKHNGLVIGRNDRMRRIVRKLKKENICFYYLPDIDLGDDNSKYVKFFAHDNTATLDTLTSLSRMTNAVVLSVQTKRNAKQYQVLIEPISFDGRRLSAEDMNQLIEQMVSENMSQYMWDLKRFGTQPNLPYGALYS